MAELKSVSVLQFIGITSQYKTLITGAIVVLIAAIMVRFLLGQLFTSSKQVTDKFVCFINNRLDRGHIN